MSDGTFTNQIAAMIGAVQQQTQYAMRAMVEDHPIDPSAVTHEELVEYVNTMVNVLQEAVVLVAARAEGIALPGN